MSNKIREIQKRKKSPRGRKQFDGRDPVEVVRKLEEAWAANCSDVQAALFADILPSTLCDYLKKNPEINERKEILKNNPRLKAKLTLKVALESGLNPDLAIKYLERLEPKEYAPLQKNATTDNEGNNINPSFDKDESKL
jgi:hypothetical protein